MEETTTDRELRRTAAHGGAPRVADREGRRRRDAGRAADRSAVVMLAAPDGARGSVSPSIRSARHASSFWTREVA